MADRDRTFGTTWLKDAALATHRFGWPGAAVAIGLPTDSPLGRIETHQERFNFLDNFVRDAIRCPEWEADFANLVSPLVVDVGCNVGLTCAWWRQLNRTTRIIGIDVMAECVEHTRQRIGEPFTGIVAAVRDVGQELTVEYDDPFCGRNNTRQPLGHRARTVPVRRLDTLLAPEPVALLKIDIEGDAGRAVVGARDILPYVRTVCVEMHSAAECESVSRGLAEGGFTLFHIGYKTGWWRSASAS